MSAETEGRAPPAENVKVQAPRSTVDLATIIGITGAAALIVAAILLGGSPGAFVDLPSICIVIGGTAGVTTACFSLKDMTSTLRIVAQTVFHHARNPSAGAGHEIGRAHV